MVNVVLLRKAVEWVEAEITRPTDQRQWDQHSWCGSRMCVAGFVAVTEGWVPSKGSVIYVERDGEIQTAESVARHALGLHPDEAFKLFIDTIDSTPEQEAQNIRQVAEAIAGEEL